MKTPNAPETRELDAAPKRDGIFGDLWEFGARLGSTDGLDWLQAARHWDVQPARDTQSLKRLIERYRDRSLAGWELTSIFRAHHHAERLETRELIQLDRQLDQAILWPEFAQASQRAGRAQLERLRPLRDQRGAQRYCQAVERGEARGWHTLVLGLMLSIYSLPLRQGLLHYAEGAISGLMRSAGHPVRLSARARQALLAELTRPLPEAIDRLMRQEIGPNPFARIS